MRKVLKVSSNKKQQSDNSKSAQPTEADITALKEHFDKKYGRK